MGLELSHLNDRRAELRQNSRQPPDWKFSTIADAAWSFADSKPDDIAIYLESEPHVTFAQMVNDASALAWSLQELGLEEGDVISFQLPNWREAAIIDLAAAVLGLIVNPIVIIYRDHEVSYMLSNSGSKCFFIPEAYANHSYLEMIDRLKPRLPELKHIVTVRSKNSETLNFEQMITTGRGKEAQLSDVDANDIKLLLYTSGTTGAPKGVLHSHRSMLWALRNCVDYWGLDENDVMVMPSPVTHITGFSFGLELALVSNTKSALMKKWNAGDAIQYFDKVQGTMMVGATPFLQELINESVKLGNRIQSLRYFACGGADVPPDIIHQAHNTFSNCRAFRVFGSTETPIITLGFLLVEEAERAATSDGCIYRYDVKITDDNNAIVENGVVGEILATGPAMMLGYLEPEHHHEAFDEEGYFHTGDLGFRTDDNALIITGRKKDIIIRGGENISAKQIEDILHTHVAIAEAAVVSMPHKRLGETTCAYIIPVQGKEISFEAIVGHCKTAGLARQKHPERVEIIDSFPRTASGKIKKDKLREMIRDTLGETG